MGKGRTLRAKAAALVYPPSGTERKAAFVHTLAEYLVGDQAHKSILLEMGKPEALAWAKLRGATPLMGYPSIEEAEKALTEFLR